MGIVAEDIAKVRSLTDIVAVIGEHTEIKRSGRQWMARCPLHGERTPSLSVSAEKGVYYCFGCQRSGDVITFVQEVESLDFSGAVEMLAARAGIRLRYTGLEEGAARSRRRRLLEAVSKAVEFYHRRLLEAADAGPARSYLRSRGYDGALVRRWRLGWAPDEWEPLARHLELSDEDLRDCGLGFINKAGRQQDYFHNRLLFAISDERGDAVGFGGRILPHAEGPKYLNTSSDAVVYDKSRVLYGLHENRAEIVAKGEAVICEGYTDVIGCAQAGLNRAVATCGTALTEEHVRLLKHFSANRLILAFDADAAGAAAAERVYEWERAFDLQVLVADLPEGRDPGDLAREDPDALRDIGDGAVPFLAFRLERVLASADTSTIESRARAAESAAAVVNEHPDPMVRDPYLVEIADRCRVNAEHLRRVRSSPPAQSRAPEAAGEPSSGALERVTAEDEALRLAIHRPVEIGSVLDATLFGDPVRREAFEALKSSDDLVAAAESSSPMAAQLLHRLAVQSGDADVVDVLSGVARLSAARAMHDLRRMAASSSDPAVRQSSSESMRWLKSQSESLIDRSARPQVLNGLLAWLVEFGRGQEAQSARALVSSAVDPG